MLSSCVTSSVLVSRYHCHPHFIEDETEIQGHYINFPWLQLESAELGCKSKQSRYKVYPIKHCAIYMYILTDYMTTGLENPQEII